MGGVDGLVKAIECGVASSFVMEMFGYIQSDVSEKSSDILANGGPISALWGREHEVRPEQLRLAEAVERAMETKSHLVAEAGTGVGKSFAYLVPAMLRCLKGEVVVITTHTIALQEQLINKDIPFLMKALGQKTPEELEAEMEDAQGAFHEESDHEHEPQPEWDEQGGPTTPAPTPTIRPVLVKGRGNYMSIRRLKLASQRQDRLFGDHAARRSLHAIEEWAYTTQDGTLSTLPQLERQGVWDKVQSDSGNCMGRKCPTYQSCFYQQARRNMESANLLVCNHALFFADLALRSQEVSILPNYQHVIIDEAHNAEEVASEYFGIKLSEYRVNFLLASLFHPRSQKGALSQLALINEETQPLDRAVAMVLQAQEVARLFFERAVDLVRNQQKEKAETDSKSFKGASESGRASNVLRLRSAGAIPNTLSSIMRELALRLKSLKELCKNEADAFEINSYSQRASMVADDAEALLSLSLPKYAYWIELSGGEDEYSLRQTAQRVELACAPIEVAPILRERLFRKEFSVTMTSATLATRTARADETTESAETAFSHYMATMGCEGAKAFQVGSPFDYKRQMEVFIPRSLSEIPGVARPSHIQTLVYHILKHVEATRGGAFVLFTSFSTLNAVAGELAAPLSKMGFPMLAQGRDGSRTRMLERFKENENSVLLGAASFWQGVDVRGQALRNVIITKLPFDPPDRPLTQARLEAIEERGGNPFMEDSLPRAIIKFKQGFGRLIRGALDTGRVVVLDPRVYTARYGRNFLAAFPPGVRITEE